MFRIGTLDVSRNPQSSSLLRSLQDRLWAELQPTGGDASSVQFLGIPGPSPTASHRIASSGTSLDSHDFEWPNTDHPLTMDRSGASEAPPSQSLGTLASRFRLAARHAFSRSLALSSPTEQGRASGVVDLSIDNESTTYPRRGATPLRIRGVDYDLALQALRAVAHQPRRFYGDNRFGTLRAILWPAAWGSGGMDARPVLFLRGMKGGW
jgi:hypothetical protein